MTACGGSGNNAPPPTPLVTGNFPQDVAISSPFFILDSGDLMDSGIIDIRQSYYNYSIAGINNALYGNIPSRFAFKPGVLFESAVAANCFSPGVNYQNHPHDNVARNDIISSDELGIWQAREGVEGNACGAEVLNSSLFAVGRHYQAIQMMFASMIYLVENSVNLTLPERGGMLDITTNINSAVGAFEDDNAIYNSGTITHLDDGSWEYHVDLNLNRDWGEGGIFTHNMLFTLKHEPVSGDEENQYSGLLNYQVTGSKVQFSGANCPESEGRTLNGSVKYQRYSAEQISLQARSAIFCGDQIDGFIVSDGEDNGMVDDDHTYNGSNQGWSETFDIFAADFNPVTLAGNYSYVSQKNPDDINSKIFNVEVTATQTNMQAESYFGFGDPIATTNGSIQRFICNLNGPNGGLSLTDRTFIDRVQLQRITLNETSGIFEPSANNIGYAPTNDCNYDGSAPNGEFLYDTNGDGLLIDETHQSITHQLWKGSEEDQLNGTTLPELISQQGITIANPPGAWPSDN